MSQQSQYVWRNDESHSTNSDGMFQTNSVMNLTGYNGCAQIKRYESSKKTADFTVSFANDRTTGRITITMLDTVTGPLKPGKYFYDILINSPAGITTRVVEGVATVKQSVTR